MRASPCRTPLNQSTTDTTAPKATGQRKFFFRFRAEARRQAMTGPIPMSARSAIPKGTLIRLKKGGPTVICSPKKPSEIRGSRVPHATAKVAATRIRLLKRKADSRERNDSIWFSLFSFGRR